jgi:geranylgeranyl reductase family protein
MLTIQADVAIIGAGPAGTAAATQLGQLGVKNVVLVDRLDFPRDKTCGSGLSPKCIKALKALNVWDEIAPESYNIHGLRLVTPGNREVYLSAGEGAAAVVCNRRTLDHIILKKALSHGVQFVPNFLVSKLIEEGGRVRGFTAHDGREVRAKYVVVADGAHSKFVTNTAPKQKLHAIMGWWDNVPYVPGHVHMVYDTMVTPGYGWLFPESPTRVNIGICYEDRATKRNARELFQAFMEKQYPEVLAHATHVGDWKGHPILYTYTIEKLFSPGRLIIGEAGRMTHPATGEGIYQGIKSGMLAAEALKKVIEQDADEHEAFAAYQRQCQLAFTASFVGAKVWRKLVQSPVVLDGFARYMETGFAKRSQAVVKRAAGLLMANA